MMQMDYQLTGKIGSGATLGLIVLQTDETIEAEFHRMFTAPDVALYVTRVPSSADVTPQTLAAMETQLPHAASLLPPSLDFDAVGYACTSGSTVIGPDRVSDLVHSAARVDHVSNPLTAVIEALSALGSRRIGMVTPYIESVTAPLRKALKSQGFAIADAVSFDEAEEAKVARIAPDSVCAAAVRAGRGDADAVFLSCTNLRTLDVIDQIEAELGKPVVSSNQALAWHMAKLAGVECDTPVGRLMRS